MGSDTKLYQVAPDGDVFLTLHNPNKPFAAWDENYEPLSELPAQRVNDLSVDQPIEVTQPPPPIRYQLSSLRLKLTSKVFKSMLTGGWKEATVDSNGKMHVNTSDWSQQALLVLMKILHNRHEREIPQEVDLELLAKIAVLVDFYQCHDAVEYWVNTTWLPNLDGWPSLDYGRDLMLGITVSWVFRKALAFRMLTRAAIMKAKAPLRGIDLPIPGNVLDGIDDKRQLALDRIISALYTALDTLRNERQRHSFQCFEAQMGALAMGMDRLNVFTTRPIQPFLGHSVSEMATGVRNFCQFKPIAARGCRIGCSSPYGGSLTYKMVRIESDISGLDLDYFLSGSQSS